MPLIDSRTLASWIVSGLIGVIFGAISAWVTFRLERRRDDIQWEREKSKLQAQHKHEKMLLELQFASGLKRIQDNLAALKKEAVRADLLKGVDDPAQLIRELQRMDTLIRGATPPMALPPSRAPGALARWLPLIILLVTTAILFLFPFLTRILMMPPK